MKHTAMNPFLPEEVYIADGEPHVFGDRVYLFGSHDKENGDTFCMLDYEFFSAPVNDLGSWTSKGINYSAKQDPLYSDELKYMFAPDCARGNDGRYYLYYCMAGYKGKGGYANPVSVAVSDTPDGKYEYLGCVRNKDGSPYLKKMCFDPAVINDDGNIRLYFGADYPWFNHIPFRTLREKAFSSVSGKTREEIRAAAYIMGAYCCPLEDDMMTIKSEPVRIDDKIGGADYKNHLFFEGSSIRKNNGKYYFIYSSIQNHELCYALSDYPDHDFIYGGTIVSNGDIGYKGRQAKDRLNHTGTNHGSIECINGQWYVFYHRLTHNSDYSRQACAEKIHIEPDGHIKQTEMTSCGLNDKPITAGTYAAVKCCNLSNGRMKHGSNRKGGKEPCVTDSGNERFITGIVRNTVIVFKYFSLSGQYRLTACFRKGAGLMEIRLNESVAGEVNLQQSESWKEYACEFSAKEGIYALNFLYRGKDSIDFLRFEITEIK